MPPSPTEDAALVARVRSRTGYRVRAALGHDAVVFTCQEPSCRAFVNQTLRWNNGGLFSPDLTTRLGFGGLMFSITAGMFALSLLLLLPMLWPLPAAVFVSALMMNAPGQALFAAALPRAGLRRLIHWAFTPFYFAFLTVLGLCRVKVRWKDEAVG